MLLLVLAEVDHMGQLIVSVIGMGIGSTLLLYPVTYLILRRRFEYKYRWTTFLLGFGITSILSGVAIVVAESIFDEIIFAGVLIPLFFSIIVILAFNLKLRTGSDIRTVTPPPLPTEVLQQESKRSDIAESIPKQSVKKPSKSDVESGAQWAKWLGIVKMVTGVVLLWVMASGDTVGTFTGLDAVFQIIIGAVSLKLGLKLLNPEKRKSTQFRTLIIIYGVAIFLHVIAWTSSATSEPPPRQIVPILTAWALWKFIKGRRELTKIEGIGDTGIL